MITSTANKQIKNIIQLTKKIKERQKQQVFVAEGIRIFEEIPKELIQAVYVSESFIEKKEHKEQCKSICYETVSDSVFQRMSDTKTPQGILCIARQPQYQLEDLLAHPHPHLLVLEGIQDPGNLGTMFRTGEGAGVTGIIISGCTDLFAPKVVRSTMGSICRVPFFITDSLCAALTALKQKQVRIYAAHLKGRACYDAFDYQGATAFLIGSEANGLTKQTADMADVYITIPMGGRLESLNAAMAAGILMYEANRQRRNREGTKSIADMV